MRSTRNISWSIIVVFAGLFVLTATSHDCNAQISPEKRYSVEGGIMREKGAKGANLEKRVMTATDSLRADSLGLTIDELKLIDQLEREDSLAAADTLSLMRLTDKDEVLSKRAQKRLDKQLRYADSSFVRHNKIFKDSMPISRVTAISMILPGFGQLYNSQAWKIPILYGTVATSTFFWLKESKSYSKYKKRYDFLSANSAISDGDRRRIIDPIQRKMIQRNTSKQLLMFGALASYIYFIGDVAVNHPGASTSVKKATTLSSIFPGAGQIYNKSFWKVPIVMGGFAGLIYIVDWNNRGYKRFKTAYNIKVLNDPNILVEPRLRNQSLEQLENYRKNYKRNRDLAIILTGAFYLFNIIDAHADAHMKDYDMSDDLTFNLEPMMTSFHTHKGGSSNMVGVSLKITF